MTSLSLILSASSIVRVLPRGKSKFSLSPPWGSSCGEGKQLSVSILLQISGITVEENNPTPGHLLPLSLIRNSNK